MSTQTQEWYASWFDTPYYHILYKDRNYNEAGAFMKRLTDRLQLPKNTSILDLACGRGRHSVYLNRLGYRVLGVDLSPSSIAFAKAQLKNPMFHLEDPERSLNPVDTARIEFEVHDMTQPYERRLDVVLNLFTSFGYFKNEEDHLKTILSIKANLNEGGVAVIDFMNVPYVLDHLVDQEIKMVDGIEFAIKRSYQDGFIFKNIQFSDEGQDFNFTERVRALTLDNFQHLFHAAGLELVDLYGDYNLSEYQEKRSPRLIMVLKKATK